MRVPKFLQYLLQPAKRIAGEMIERARDNAKAGRYRDAAFLYEEALRLMPGRASVHIQCGHMWKETGAFKEAERHYDIAYGLRPNDPDLMLQFGHFYKQTGRLLEAEQAYRRARAMKPDWTVPAAELARLAASGWYADLMAARHDRNSDDPAAAPEPLSLAESSGMLAPGLARREPPAIPSLPEEVKVHRLGRIEPTHWGDGRIMRGVEAIRGYCLTTETLVELQIIMGGLALYRGPVRLGKPVSAPDQSDPSHKYVFNVWLDVSHFVVGRYAIELRLIDTAGRTRSHHDRVVVAEPWPESRCPESDALITLTPGDPRSIEAQLAERRSVVHSAKRCLFPQTPQAILVQRTDQLGDLVASIPALVRLRALFPDARIVGLLTAANADFAKTLSFFNDIVTIDFPDDPVARQRLMSLDDQAALAAKLRPFNFDLAIDLATSGVSRPLLRLSGAPFTFGTGDALFPWLSASFDFNIQDPVTGTDRFPHSAKVLAMIEALGAALGSQATVMGRDDLKRENLIPLGLPAGEPFVVLHAGARIGFSHWPHYPALARLLLDGSRQHVVILTEDHSMRARLPVDLLASDRFLLIDRRLPFDDLDALLSFCTVMVGNDSGPKHLAALRGTQVVTLFTNRISYAEWGQEATGVIMTRKVPCAGCQIFHDADECGKDFICITGIRPDEVFDTVRGYL
jgi:ADP-heptose:LPS heptosyltransferase/tetratricopeptide (TPR) repeat protein